MKKLIIAAVAFGLLFGFASCTKTGSCECAFSTLGTVVTVQEFDDVSKSDCKEAEEAGNKEGKGLVTVKCVFK